MRAGFSKCTLLGAIFVSAIAGVPAYAQSEPLPWKSITAERLLHPEPGDWLNYRRTYDVNGYSPLDKIDKNNVRQLRPVWSYSFRDSSRWEPTPIVANGIMYVSEASGRVIAFDVATGDVIWIHERRLPEDIAISEAYTRMRGVSIYGDKIYWATADCYLIALDARTGKLVWEVKTGDYHTGEGHSHPPLIADGKVFLGLTGGDKSAQGRFRAFDVETGKLLWTVYTAPRKGDPGYETWSKHDIEPLGAAPWNTASYDPELKLVYFSTGNPEPWSELLRGPGAALYSNSALAVDAETGKIRWYFQMSPDDSYDRAAYESMLVDLNINGKPRKALILTGKIGWGVILDRATGEFLQPFKTAYDNMVTGWTKEGKPIINQDLQPKPGDIESGKVFEVCPHQMGARNMQAPSFSPVTHLYYLGVNNSCMDASVTTAKFSLGSGYSGVRTKPKLVPGYDYVGEFVAFDPVTRERVWTYRPKSGSVMTASALATGGGIVFGGTGDRQFFALDSNNGQLLWQTRMSGDISGAPMTFEVGGRQYVAIAVGGRTGPTTMLGPLTGVDIPKGTGELVVLALPPANGTEPAATKPRSIIMSASGLPEPPARANGGTRAAASATPAAAGAGRSMLDGAFTAAQASLGEQKYTAECASCHNVGEHTGGAFRSKWGGNPVDFVFDLISKSMPANKPGSLASEDYANIVAFFLSKSGYTPGAQDLPADRAVLQKLLIEAPAK